MGYGPEWSTARQVPLDRDLGRCAICGQLASDPHHRVAMKAGGRAESEDPHSPEKLLSLCRAHHSWVHQHPALCGPLGYTLQVGQDPLVEPVWYQAESCWFLLLASGVRVPHPNWQPPARTPH
jgi:hypothetical protein